MFNDGNESARGRRYRILARFCQDESGVTGIEYGLIGTLVAVAIIVGATALGTKLGQTFQTVADTVSSAI